MPVTILSLIWLAVIVGALFHPNDRTLVRLTEILWAVFVLHFVIEFGIAPHKLAYLKRSWITALSLALPAVGLLRVIPLVRILIGFEGGGYYVLLSLLGSANRGLRAFGRLFHARGLEYVLGMSLIVTFGGAAGIQYFESPAAVHAVGATGGIASFGDALWYSAMQMTTVGSAYSPVTGPGRTLSFFLTVFGVSVAGYVTASVATYLVKLEREGH